MMRIESARSSLPQGPNIIAPEAQRADLHAGAAEESVLHAQTPVGWR